MAQVAEKGGGAAPPVARVTVNLPARVWNELATLADRKQISKTEALRQAISTHAIIDRAREEGARVVIERPDGSREVMVFAY
jgi:hypothetical protein